MENGRKVYIINPISRGSKPGRQSYTISSFKPLNHNLNSLLGTNILQQVSNSTFNFNIYKSKSINYQYYSTI